MTVIAGRLSLMYVMRVLARRRPVFHSEADFQFAFAQAIAQSDSGIAVRLEVRQAAGRSEYVDLACWTASQRTLIELKYPTAGWSGTDPAGEPYRVRNHAAYDLARRYFIHDIHRLERFVETQPNSDGLAIMLTNEPSLWSDGGRRRARDANFRAHEGRVLTGHLSWGPGGTPQYDRCLRGTYTARWHDYSVLNGPKGRFRWLPIPVSGPRGR